MPDKDLSMAASVTCSTCISACMGNWKSPEHSCRRVLAEACFLATFVLGGDTQPWRSSRAAHAAPPCLHDCARALLLASAAPDACAVTKSAVTCFVHTGACGQRTWVKPHARITGSPAPAGPPGTRAAPALGSIRPVAPGVAAPPAARATRIGPCPSPCVYLRHAPTAWRRWLEDSARSCIASSRHSSSPIFVKPWLSSSSKVDDSARCYTINSHQTSQATSPLNCPSAIKPYLLRRRGCSHLTFLKHQVKPLCRIVKIIMQKKTVAPIPQEIEGGHTCRRCHRACYFGGRGYLPGAASWQRTSNLNLAQTLRTYSSPVTTGVAT